MQIKGNIFTYLPLVSSGCSIAHHHSPSPSLWPSPSTIFSSEVEITAQQID